MLDGVILGQAGSGWIMFGGEGQERLRTNDSNQSVAAIDFPSQKRIDGNSIALVCYRVFHGIEVN
jgi:hypothetical protein